MLSFKWNPIMTFKQKIAEKLLLVKDNEKVQSWLKREAWSLYGNIELENLSDHQYAFLYVVVEDAENEGEMIRIWRDEYKIKVLECARSFYNSDRVELKHLYVETIYYPSEESDIWELVYGVKGGDLMVYLKFDGFDFVKLSSAD